MSLPKVFKQVHPADQSINPFNVYKQWTYSSESAMSASGIVKYFATKPDLRNYTLNEYNNTAGTDGDYSGLSNIIDNRPCESIWLSIHQLLYKQPELNYFDVNKQSYNLYTSASVLSIPQALIGSGLQSGSFQMIVDNPFIESDFAVNSKLTIVDDGNGNLIHTGLYKYEDAPILSLQAGKFEYDLVLDRPESDQLIPLPVDGVLQNLDITSYGVIISPISTYTLSNWGHAFNLRASTYIRIPNIHELNLGRSDRYTVSFNVYVAFDGDIFSKYTYARSLVDTNTGLQVTDKLQTQSRWPIRVYISGGELILSYKSDKEYTISTTISYETRYSVIVVNNGIELQLYLNGVQVGAVPISNQNSDNTSDIFIGCSDLDANGFGGNIDNINIFNTDIDGPTIDALSGRLSFRNSYIDSTLPSNRIGNIIYDKGLIIITDPRPLYCNICRGATYSDATLIDTPAFTTIESLNFRSTVTIYEHEYICRIPAGEFNMTLNPTIRNGGNLDSSILAPKFDTTQFNPYITTIGLYNENGELLIVGKLSNPIQKRPNVDMNLVIKLDV